MYFYHQPVRTHGNCRHCQWFHQLGISYRMARVNYNRQMRQFFQNRDCGEIKCVLCSGFKCSDTTFPKYDIFVSASHDVFRAHQKLVNRIGKAAFEQYGLLYFSEFLEQFKILHIPCADLY